MSWKSRWSWVRLVNTRTANVIPPARPRSSAWEETSIAHAWSPSSSMRAKVAWRSTASGVVRSTSSSRPPTTLLTVPSSPHWVPVSSSRWRTRNAVVVLPLVPVIPTTFSRAVGSPWKAAAAGPIASRTLGTTTSGTPRSSGRSHTSAAAPRSTASGAKSWPSARKPGTQKKRAPGRTAALEYARAVMSTGGTPGPRSSRRSTAGESRRVTGALRTLSRPPRTWPRPPGRGSCQRNVPCTRALRARASCFRCHPRKGRVCGAHVSANSSVG